MTTEDAEFRDLVRRMREAQTEYFQTRDRDVLSISKSLERQVDAELERGLHPGLFDQEVTNA